MEQERVVNKIVRDMRQHGLITLNEQGDPRLDEAKFFVNLAFGAGFDFKTKANNCQKKVVQEDRHHKFIQEFPSMTVARRAFRMSKAGMINAIKYSHLTRKGYFFRYADTLRSTVDQGGDGGR